MFDGKRILIVGENPGILSNGQIATRYQMEWAEASGVPQGGLASALDKQIASDRVDGILAAAAWAL